MIDTSIELNADFTQRVVVKPNEYVWESSPMPGVERMKLDRIGDEIARATSLVRYAPIAAFHHMNMQAAKKYLYLMACLVMNMGNTQQAPIFAILLAPDINR